MTTIYLDMDGVVADWDRRAGEILGERDLNMSNEPEARWSEARWNELKKIKHYYRDLPKMKDADRMANVARAFRDQLGYELIFLTAIPRGNDVPWAFWDKMLWAQEFFPDIPVHFGPYSTDKADHCQPGDILVDDREDNCSSWEQAGGTAVRVDHGKYTEAVNQLLAVLAQRSARY